MKKVLFVSQSVLPPEQFAQFTSTFSTDQYACSTKSVQEIKNADYDNYDLLIGMEQADIRDLYYICGGDFATKIFLLSEYFDHQNNRPVNSITLQDDREEF